MTGLGPVTARRAWWAIAVMFAAAFAAAVPLTFVMLQSRATLDQIRDCTTVGRKCHDDGQKRTQDAIQRLIDAQIAVAVCSQGAATEEQLRVCVTDRLRGPR